MAKKDLLSQIAQELPKYRLVVSKLSILPFAVHVYVIYLPTNEKVGEVIWNVFSGVKANITVTIQNKKYAITYDNGEWSISEWER
ncbi:MAG: hypothetical protein QXO46_08290 [Nitrososphaerota archaeon]